MICAHAVSVSFKKFQGVDFVDVSLNKGLATVKLASGNKVRVEDLWESVRKNGFTPKNTKVTVRGNLLYSNAKPKLKVPETNQIYDLVTELPASELAKHSGQSVVIEGVMTPSPDKKASVPIRVTGLK